VNDQFDLVVPWAEIIGLEDGASDNLITALNLQFLPKDLQILQILELSMNC
jgi:hypothetical protein